MRKRKTTRATARVQVEMRTAGVKATREEAESWRTMAPCRGGEDDGRPEQLKRGIAETVREGAQEYGIVRTGKTTWVLLGGMEVDLITREMSGWAVPADRPQTRSGRLNMQLIYFQPREIVKRGSRYVRSALAWA